MPTRREVPCSDIAMNFGKAVQQHFRWHTIFGVTLFCAVACQREDSNPSSGPAADLEPVPSGVPAEEAPREAAIETPPGPGEGDPDLLFTKNYIVPPDFLTSVPEGSAMPDPFASPPPTRKTAQEILESFGVVFGAGASATYHPGSSQIIVRNTSSQLELVDALVQTSHRTSTQQMTIRVEIYQLPALVALNLEQNAATEADHTPGWENVIRMVGRGEATFVTSANVIARSGQRSRAEDMFESNYTDYRPVDPEKKDRVIPVFETHQIGTIFEVDPVLGPDNKIIDLNLTLEHHSAPPTYRTVSVKFADSEQIFNLPAPEFHVKKITTQLTMKEGNVKLIGAWRPTGKPEFQANDLMQIAFLKIDIQMQDFYPTQ